MVTVQIGNNNPFQRARFSSYAQLFYYMTQEFTPNDEDPEENVWPLMSIVTIDMPREQIHTTGKKNAKKRAKKGRQNSRRR